MHARRWPHDTTHCRLYNEHCRHIKLWIFFVYIHVPLDAQRLVYTHDMGCLKRYALGFHWNLPRVRVSRPVAAAAAGAALMRSDEKPLNCLRCADTGSLSGNTLSDILHTYICDLLNVVCALQKNVGACILLQPQHTPYITRTDYGLFFFRILAFASSVWATEHEHIIILLYMHSSLWRIHQHCKTCILYVVSSHIIQHYKMSCYACRRVEMSQTLPLSFVGGWWPQIHLPAHKYAFALLLNAVSAVTRTQRCLLVGHKMWDTIIVKSGIVRVAGESSQLR